MEKKVRILLNTLFKKSQNPPQTIDAFDDVYLQMFRTCSRGDQKVRGLA